MKIYLVRHGSAVPPEVNPEKTLSPQGKEEVTKIARALGMHAFPLSDIFHSDKLRAKETAEIMCKHLAPALQLKQYANLAPNDPIDPILTQITRQKEDVMIVGHLPFLTKLSSHLLVSREDCDIIQFGPATTACLETKNSGWIINWVVEPSLF